MISGGFDLLMLFESEPSAGSVAVPRKSGCGIVPEEATSSPGFLDQFLALLFVEPAGPEPGLVPLEVEPEGEAESEPSLLLEAPGDESISEVELGSLASTVGGRIEAKPQGSVGGSEEEEAPGAGSKREQEERSRIVSSSLAFLAQFLAVGSPTRSQGDPWKGAGAAQGGATGAPSSGLDSSLGSAAGGQGTSAGSGPAQPPPALFAEPSGSTLSAVGPHSATGLEEPAPGGIAEPIAGLAEVPSEEPQLVFDPGAHRPQGREKGWEAGKAVEPLPAGPSPLSRVGSDLLDRFGEPGLEQQRDLNPAFRGSVREKEVGGARNGFQGILETVTGPGVASSLRPFTAPAPAEPATVSYTGVPVVDGALEELVERARYLKAGESVTLQVDLKPKHFGNLRIEAVLNADQTVTTTIRVDDPAVRQLLESRLPFLLENFQQHGLDIEKVHLDTLSAGPGSESHSGFRGSGGSKREDGNGPNRTPAPATSLTAEAESGEEPARRVDDGRIHFFA